jgi:hypothetical protein
MTFRIAVIAVIGVTGAATLLISVIAVTAVMGKLRSVLTMGGCIHVAEAGLIRN